MKLEDLRVKLFCDSANILDMEEMRNRVQGYTSNPSLARRAGVVDYLAFCREAAQRFPNHSLSLEVLAEEPQEAWRQAKLLSHLGPNVSVKVPIVTSTGQSNTPLIRDLAASNVSVNVTACFTRQHVRAARDALRIGDPQRSYISVFAGRIADSGACPEPLMSAAAWFLDGTPTELIWASVREPYNVVEAHRCQVPIITVFPEMLRRLNRFGRDLDEFAIETSAMFARDAREAGYTL